MNRERAETYLRLVAEAELRRVATPARDGAATPPAVPVAGRGAVVLRRSAVAAALYDLPRHQREVIALQYYVNLSEAETAAALHISRGAVHSHAAAAMAALRAALQTGTSSRVAQVAQVLTSVRAIDGTGPRLTVITRARGEFVPPGIEHGGMDRPVAVFPVHQFTARDDHGTSYQLGFRGRRGRHCTELAGEITLDPGPPPGTRWLELTTGPGEPAARIALNPQNGPPDGAGVTVRDAGTSPGEHLLHHMAARLLLLALAFGHEIHARCRARLERGKPPRHDTAPAGGPAAQPRHRLDRGARRRAISPGTRHAATSLAVAADPERPAPVLTLAG